jgi:CBS domain-containing protein
VDDTVESVLPLLNRAIKDKRPPCLLVVEQEAKGGETIKGFVTPEGVIFGLATRFLKGAGKSGPIFWEGQLTAEYLDGLNKNIGEIMVPIEAYIRENEMLMEAIFLLHKYRKDFLPVTNKEEMIGTIHINDILKEIVEISSMKNDVATTDKILKAKFQKNEIRNKQKEVRHG